MERLMQNPCLALEGLSFYGLRLEVQPLKQEPPFRLELLLQYPFQEYLFQLFLHSNSYQLQILMLYLDDLERFLLQIIFDYPILLSLEAFLHHLLTFLLKLLNYF